MKFNSNDNECLSTRPRNLHVSFDRGAVMKAAGGRTGGMPGCCWDERWFLLSFL